MTYATPRTSPDILLVYALSGFAIGVFVYLMKPLAATQSWPLRFCR